MTDESNESSSLAGIQNFHNFQNFQNFPNFPNPPVEPEDDRRASPFLITWLEQQRGLGPHYNWGRAHTLGPSLVDDGQTRPQVRWSQWISNFALRAVGVVSEGGSDPGQLEGADVTVAFVVPFRCSAPANSIKCKVYLVWLKRGFLIIPRLS